MAEFSNRKILEYTPAELVVYTYITGVRINLLVHARVAARGNGTCCKSSLSSSLTTKKHKLARVFACKRIHIVAIISHIRPLVYFGGTAHNILCKKRHGCRNDAVFTTIHKVVTARYETCILSARENLFPTKSPPFTFTEYYFSLYV